MFVIYAGWKKLRVNLARDIAAVPDARNRDIVLDLLRGDVDPDVRAEARGVGDDAGLTGMRVPSWEHTGAPAFDLHGTRVTRSGRRRAVNT